MAFIRDCINQSRFSKSGIVLKSDLFLTFQFVDKGYLKSTSNPVQIQSRVVTQVAELVEETNLSNVIGCHRLRSFHRFHADADNSNV